MENKVDNRIAYLNGLYRGIWLGAPRELIDIGKFTIDLKFKLDKDDLIKADRLIYQQILICRKLHNHRNILYRQFNIIDKALLEVHRGIFNILQTDYRIESCWVNDNGEIDYLRI